MLLAALLELRLLRPELPLPRRRTGLARPLHRGPAEPVKDLLLHPLGGLLLFGLAFLLVPGRLSPGAPLAPSLAPWRPLDRPAATQARLRRGVQAELPFQLVRHNAETDPRSAERFCGGSALVLFMSIWDSPFVPYEAGKIRQRGRSWYDRQIRKAQKKTKKQQRNALGRLAHQKPAPFVPKAILRKRSVADGGNCASSTPPGGDPGQPCRMGIQQASEIPSGGCNGAIRRPSRDHSVAGLASPEARSRC